MRPSARQLIEGIDWSLTQRVVPVTEDRWAASTLRSIHCLLQHLAARVEQEGQLLHDDNADLRSVLGEVRDLLAGVDGWQRTCAAVAAALERPWREAGGYPTVDSLAAENDALRGLVDDMVRELHLPARRAPEGVEARVLAGLDAYLGRRLQREQPLFVPAFLSSTF